MSRLTRAVYAVKRLSEDEDVRQTAALVFSIIGSLVIRILQRR